MARPRYGIWIPVYGNCGAMNHPAEPQDASYGRAKALIQLAEVCGFTTTLLAEHIIHPRTQDFDQLETWTTAAALAEATSTIEIIAAVKPLLFNPAVLAKMALGIDAISQGRFAINLVSAWFRPELEKAGIPLLNHDQRYHYSEEWLHAVTGLWSGERVTMQGDYVQISDLRLRPRPIAQPHPTVYLGGESEPARALAAKAADVLFMNGRPLDVIQAIIHDVARRPRPIAQPLRYALSAFIIARPTDAEAQEEYAYLSDLSSQDDRSQMRQGRDPDTVMLQSLDNYPAVGSNGGTAAGLVGSYETVATRIAAFVRAGVDTFMLQFQPFRTEMPRFAQEIMPRVAQRVDT